MGGASGPWPAALIFVGLMLLGRAVPIQARSARALAISALLACNAVYLAWRLGVMPPLEAGFAPLWQWCFFILEAETLLRSSLLTALFVRREDLTPRADLLEASLRRRTTLPTVDVLIPTYSENAEILERTITAALALDYPGELLTIWILDDTRRPWLRQLCERRGVGYLTRETNRGAKAGNLNNALPRCNGELLLVLDADFAVVPGFLYRTVGFFGEADVGIVQTPQHFINPDPVQWNLGGALAWSDEQRFFQDVYNPVRSAWNQGTCVGTGFVVRRACIDEILGFPEASICEDFYSTYLLKARGYRLVFLNEALAFGLSSESLAEYVGQRGRWCLGTLQTLYLPGGPLRARGLSLVDRLFYIEGAFFWTAQLALPVFLLAPAVYFFSGVQIVPCDPADVWVVMLPRLAVAVAVNHWLAEGTTAPVISFVQRLVTLAVIIPTVLKALVAPFGERFRVTLKGQLRDRVVVQWALLWPFAAVALLTLAGFALNLTFRYETVSRDDSWALNLWFAGTSLLVNGLCCLACIELPNRGGALQTAAPALRTSLGGTVRALFSRLVGG